MSFLLGLLNCFLHWGFSVFELHLLVPFSLGHYFSQEDERQTSEDCVLRVLPEPDHDTELREAQPAWLPEDHEEVRQEPQLQGQLQYILQVASIFSTIHLKIFRKGPNGKMKPSLHLN